MNVGLKWEKIVLAGDSGVGKTCLITYLISHRFVETEINTIGAYVQDWTYRNLNKTVQIKIWDTAGQERYKSLAPIYFREAIAGVFVYDATDFDPIPTLESWINSYIQDTVNDDYIIAIAANKIDLLSDTEEFTRTKAKIEEYYHTSVYSVSAKTGEGVQELFKDIAEKISLKINRKGILKPQPIEEEKSGCCM